MKQKRYWLWVGVVGILLSIGAYYYLDNIGDSAIVNIPYFPAIIVSIVLFGLDAGTNGPEPLIIFMIYGFIIGSIMGWIYGRFKK